MRCARERKPLVVEHPDEILLSGVRTFAQSEQEGCLPRVSSLDVATPVRSSSRGRPFVRRALPANKNECWYCSAAVADYCGVVSMHVSPSTAVQQWLRSSALLEDSHPDDQYVTP